MQNLAVRLRFSLVGMVLFTTSGYLITNSLAQSAVGPQTKKNKKTVIPKNGNITITVSGVSPVKGGLFASLHNIPDAFPMKPDKAYKNISRRVSGGQIVLSFTDIPYGRYAISIYHDANDNKKLDSNFMGIPKEGVASSRDAKGFMGPPKFKDAAFTLDKTRLRLTAKMAY